MRLLIFALLMAAGHSLAQTAVPARTHNCKVSANGTALVPVHMPVVVAGITLTVPLCVSIGPNIRINGSTTPPQLEVIPEPAAAAPRQVLHKMALATLSPTLPTSSTVDITLQYTPAPGTHILFIFRSSRIGGDVVEVVAPTTTGNTKLVRVDVPDYRPFTTDDQITMMYFTTEPAVP